jgi:hypothetical protein
MVARIVWATAIVLILISSDISNWSDIFQGEGCEYMAPQHVIFLLGEGIHKKF